jgi:plasmid maintenance system killer protein
MKLHYNDNMKEACHDLHVAKSSYGKQIANKLHRKVALLNAADTLREFMAFDNHAHWLQGNRQWDFSVPLANGNSLILQPIHLNSRAPQEHNEMKVIKIEDYHD